MAGSVRALELAYKITRRGGTTVTAGLPPPTATLALPPVNLVAEERTLKGSYIGTCVPLRDIPRYIELYRRGRLPVDRLMSRHLRLDEINEGFDLLTRARRAAGGDGVGVVVRAGGTFRVPPGLDEPWPSGTFAATGKDELRLEDDPVFRRTGSAQTSLYKARLVPRCARGAGPARDPTG